MKSRSPHWSSQNLQTYRMSVLSSFLTQIQNRMEVLGWNSSYLADHTYIPLRRIYAIMHQNVMPTLAECMKITLATSCSIAIVALPNHDDKNLGPINSEVFHALWYKAEKPLNLSDVDDLKITKNLKKWRKR